MHDVICCTIAATNYLPFTRICAESYIRHHPEHRCVIAIIDANPGDPLARFDDDRIEVVGNSIFGFDADTYLRMATAYGVTEFATALKPSLLRALRLQADVVVYLDPDIEVFGKMGELSQLAQRYGIVLTPHFLRPLPRDGLMPDERAIMNSGIFNLGFIAVGPGSEPFIEFWAERLRQDAVVAPDQQLFTDQRWIDQVPALFMHYVLRDPGFNVAYWNVHERELIREPSGRITAGGSPLRFFHFSGFRPERYPLLSYHCSWQPRVLLSQHPEAAALCRRYSERLTNNGYEQTVVERLYGYAQWPDGTLLTQAERRIFREDWIAAERKGTDLPPHAFGADGGTDLQAWFRKPSNTLEASSGLNRFAMMVWSIRPDIQAAYPDPYGDDAPAFRRWCRDFAVSENMLPAWASPPEPRLPADPGRAFGVNLVGYLTAELGVGEIGRLLHDAIVATKIPVASTIEEASVRNRTALPPPTSVGSSRYSVSIFVINADQIAQMLAIHPQTFHHKYRIGVWAWELEEFPDWLRPALDIVDEVWAISEFVRAAVARHTKKPVRVFPVPVRDPRSQRHLCRKSGTQFLFAFDFNSVARRKNAAAVVDAFREAFSDRKDVSLVIKAINGSHHIAEAERLRMLVAGDERIRLLERYLSVRELETLYAESDAYVSLHRSEGFGLTIAEAMARALPVIATNYSAITEFFGAFAGWPISYRMTKVGTGCEPYAQEASWAEPDIHAAANAMREIADNPSEARRRGAAGRTHVLQTRSMKQAAEWVSSHVQAAHNAWLASPRASGHDELMKPADIMGLGRKALDRTLDIELKPNNPLKRGIHDISVQAFAPYKTQMHHMVKEIYDTTESAVRLLQAHLDRTTLEIRELRELVGQKHREK